MTAFAQDHDLAVSLALTALLQCGPLPAPALARAHLPLAQGGLGLLSATSLSPAAFWASWADTLPTITRQATHIAARLEAGLHDPTQAPPSLQAAHAAAAHLHQQGWSPPQMADLPHSNQLPAPAPHEEGPPTTRRGWQQPAVTATHNAMTAEFLATLDSASQAMMASQSGPFASRAFTTIPFSPEFHYPSHLFRLLLLRRLRLPLPLTERHCRCRRVLDPLGNHRAACPRSGALRERGSPLEQAAARVCREAGARVTTHTLLSHLNIPSVSHVDNRRIEVIVNGLPLFQGAQLAVDTTLVSPLTSSSQPRRRQGVFTGAALAQARRSKERTYPELVNAQRCRLIVLAIEIGGRFSSVAATFLRLLARARARAAPATLQQTAAPALVSRWSALPAHAAHHAFAASLDMDVHTDTCPPDGDAPPISEVPADASRLAP